MHIIEIQNIKTQSSVKQMQFGQCGDSVKRHDPKSRFNETGLYIHVERDGV